MEHRTLTITAVVAGGDGLARDERGRVTFVAGALPGEVVEVELVAEKRDFARAVVVDVVEPSPDRVAPPCPFVAAGCGGCDWQHIAPTAQLRHKAAIVADALHRQARLEVPISEGAALAATHYRTTLRGVAVEGRFGFRRRHSHDVVAVDPCLVAHPLLAESIADGRFPDGDVVLRAGSRTGERLVVVDGDEPVQVPGDVRVVTAKALTEGHRAWFHEEVAGQRWRISARSFFQARPDGAEALVDAVKRAVAGSVPDGGHVVDLYGGVGLFAGTVAPRGATVTLVEQGASSVADARINLVDQNARIVRADVGHWGVTRADAVVADPPRQGLGPRVVGRIAKTNARRLALVSCDAAAFGHDAKLLAGAGYELVGAELIDLFPHTSHVEVISRFDRR